MKSNERAMAEAPPLKAGPVFTARLLAGLPTALSAHQPVFDKTGALHAAAIADASGNLHCARQDIGRHNAVDKVVGWAARSGFNLGAHVLVISGRASYEIVQKSLAAGISCIVAVGGVSSLAIELAEEEEKRDELLYWQRVQKKRRASGAIQRQEGAVVEEGKRIQAMRKKLSADAAQYWESRSQLIKAEAHFSPHKAPMG